MPFSCSVAKALLCLFIICLTKPIKAELDDYLPKVKEEGFITSPTTVI